MMTLTGRLAEDEFAFRYLSPNGATTEARPLDRVEQDYQFTNSAHGDCLSLSSHFRSVVIGKTPSGDLRQRLLTILMQVHLPACVTPLTGYGLHASYPSPRAYYPMQFLLDDRVEEALWHVDMGTLQLRRVGGAPAGPDGGAPYALLIKTNFFIYAPLYNLFRKSLFALECGHFLSEFMLLAQKLGIHAEPKVTPGAIRLALRDVNDGATAEADPLAAHRQFARERNSGRFYQGFFPAPSTFCERHLVQLTGAIVNAVRDAVRIFPGAARLNLTAKLCLRAAPGVAPGIYRVGADGLVCLSPDDPIDECERFYNYTAFSFRFVPAMLFWCVDELAYACADADFLEMNIVLGYLNQQLIRVILDGEMLGRPFRSYDQLGIDHLLHNSADGLRTYYGLMVARNRCSDALGMLR